MNDPIKIYNDIRNAYYKYIGSGLPFFREEYNLERNKLIREPGTISQPPIIEIVPKYHEKTTLKDFCVAEGVSTELNDFVNCGLFSQGGSFERKLLPGQVKPNNIRHTHFSRNPKIAAFLKAYHYVKEFGEGFDRICREQEANGENVPSFRTDEFILKISVPKVTEKRTETEQKRDVSEQNRIETEQKPNRNDVKLTEKREAILLLMSENPYISKAEISKLLGLHPSAVSRNIEAMRGKYLRRVGPDKGGFWEIIK